MEDSQALTWNQLVRLEPRLGQLQLDCRFADSRSPNGFDADLAWNGNQNIPGQDTPGLKIRLERLVGAKADVQDPGLISEQAYALASAECYRALPPNRPGVNLPEKQSADSG